MKDLFHYVGNDLSTSSTGDVLPVTGPEMGKQRILRRLVTNPGDYLAHPDYGAGLGSFIGEALDVPRLRSLIRTQMLMERAVAASPPPDIAVTPLLDGVAVSIRYVDVSGGQWQQLAFSLNR